MGVKMCKKGIAWILALMLVLSMAPSVFAAEGDESGEDVYKRQGKCYMRFLHCNFVHR